MFFRKQKAENLSSLLPSKPPPVLGSLSSGAVETQNEKSEAQELLPIIFGLDLFLDPALHVHP